MERRHFIKKMAILGSSLPIIDKIHSQIPSHLTNKRMEKDKFIWANLIHLGYNMWQDVPLKEIPKTGNDFWDIKVWYNHYHPELTLNKSIWDKILEQTVKAGMNMVVIDVGDGVKYDSHPEIAVKGAWTPDELRNELKRIRKMGLEPIPKLNFSTSHKAWLGPYQRMISTDTYYGVCKNLIEEVCNIFESPRFFHLGMDEEKAEYQKDHVYVVVRQNDLWWNDLYYLANIVEKQNVRPWIWSDYLWDKPEELFKKMPKSIMQSNWYYGLKFKKEDGSPINSWVNLYGQLEKHGFEQIPTASNYNYPTNFKDTVEYCNKIISPERLKGYMQSTWLPCLPTPFIEQHIEAIDQVAEVIKSNS